jgi:hypothetical protein
VILLADDRRHRDCVMARFDAPAGWQRRDTVPTLSLSFLNRRKTKQVCRICRELAEPKEDRLCAHCVWIKSRISLRFAEAVRGTIAIPAAQHCKRLGCSCAACDGRTLDPHPLYVFDLARADRREIHFHPRCHDLWLEAVKGPSGGPEQIPDVGREHPAG